MDENEKLAFEAIIGAEPLDGNSTHLAAEALYEVAEDLGISLLGVEGDGTNTVEIRFASIVDAGLMMTLAFDGPGAPGSVYDHATGSCVTLASLDEDACEDEVARAFAAGWLWTFHPVMVGRRVMWHATVDIPVADVLAVTAALNEIANGGAV